jgi:hypothetical protein
LKSKIKKHGLKDVDNCKEHCKIFVAPSLKTNSRIFLAGRVNCFPKNKLQGIP